MRRKGSFSIAAAWLALASGLVASGGADAHTGGTTGYASVRVEGQAVRYSLSLPVEVAQAAASDPLATGDPSQDQDALAAIVARHVAISADGASCAPLPGVVQPPSPGRSTVVIVVQYACPAPPRSLLLHDSLFVPFGRDHHTIVNVEWSGGSQQVILDPDRSQALVSIAAPGAAAEPRAGGALAFFHLGLEHILTGWDHILFLFALILGGGSIRSLLGIVTAFTVAHSATLGLAALDLVRPPERLIEPLIALSIAYVAVENIVTRKAPSWRWLASFLFGLVHGFGFAGALVVLGLPGEALLSSLVFFNLGVEVGQAVIIAVLFPALLWLTRFPGKRRAVTSISAAVLTAALALLVVRL